MVDDGKLYTAVEAARILDIPAHRVHQWHCRDRIVPFGTNLRGHPRFHVDDLRRMNRRALEDPRTWVAGHA